MRICQLLAQALGWTLPLWLKRTETAKKSRLRCRCRHGRWKRQWQDEIVDLHWDAPAGLRHFPSSCRTSQLWRVQDVCPSGVTHDHVLPIFPDGQRGPGVCDWEKQTRKLCKRLLGCHVGSWSTMDLCSTLATLCPAKLWPCLGLSSVDGQICCTHKCGHSLQYAGSRRLQRNLALQKSTSPGNLRRPWHNLADDPLEDVLGWLQMGTLSGRHLCFLLPTVGLAESSSDSTAKFMEMDHGLCRRHHMRLWKSVFLHQWTGTHWGAAPCLCHGLHDTDLQACGPGLWDPGWKLGREGERCGVHLLHAVGWYVNAIPFLSARTPHGSSNRLACLCGLHPDGPWEDDAPCVLPERGGFAHETGLIPGDVSQRWSGSRCHCHLTGPRNAGPGRGRGSVELGCQPGALQRFHHGNRSPHAITPTHGGPGGVHQCGGRSSTGKRWSKDGPTARLPGERCQTCSCCSLQI